MAKCDQGYICQVCGEEVKGIAQSDLYLRFVIGWVDAETLHLQPERHIKCNPSLAQFIDDPQFSELVVDQEFQKCHLDEEFISKRTSLVTRGFERLKSVANQKLPITEYPLEEFRNNFSK